MYQLSEYFFTATDAKELITSTIRLVRDFTQRDWKGIGIIVVITFILGIFTELTLGYIFFWCFLFAIFYWNWDSRVSIFLGLMGLVVIPILLFLTNINLLLLGDIWAENIAVWVYFFLCIGVIKQIYEFKVPPRPLPAWEDIPIARHFVRARVGARARKVEVKEWKLKPKPKRKK